MSSRDTVLASVRRALGVSGNEVERHAAVAARLSEHPAGVIPQRGQLPLEETIALFRRMVAAAGGTTTQMADPTDLPREIASLLRAHNLPLAVRHGGDSRLKQLRWDREPTLTVATGPSDGNDPVGVSYAFGAAAESGTVMLLSGPDNPTTLNFLPDTHIVLVDAADIAGDYETLWARLRQAFGPGRVPRTANLVTGPSRSADVEQTLILGAHGPRRLHVIVAGGV